MTLFVVMVLFVCAAQAQIAEVRFWAYQLQGLDREGAVEALVESRYDMLVLEPTRTDRDCTDFDARAMVDALHASPGTSLPRKIVLAYIDIGEAEDWRTYWQDWWVAPTDTSRGNPDFLLAPDPDGWSGNYPVAFWDERWWEIIIDGDSSLVKLALADGFDGVYLDWIEAYDDPVVAAFAESAGVDPDSAMVAFVEHIREVARGIDHDFLVVGQNGIWLADEQPLYFSVVDGVAQEDLSFGGEADVPWGDPRAGDIPQGPHEQAEMVEMLLQYKDRGLPVFTCDYALLPENVELAYEFSYSHGFVPFVSQTPLDRLPDYYPPGYSISERYAPNSFALSVSPNPAAGLCRISLPGAGSFAVFDLAGRVVWRGAVFAEGTTLWRPEDPRHGVYILRWRGVDGKQGEATIVLIR